MPQPKDLPQAAAGPAPQVAQVVLVHQPRVVGADEGPAPLHKGLQLVLEPCPQQVQHGGHHQLVAVQPALLVDDVHRHAHAPQGLVVGLHLLHIVEPHIPGPHGLLHGPLVLPVVHDGRPGGGRRPLQPFQCFQPQAHGLHVLKLPGVPGAAVVHHRPVELLKAAPAFPELEVLHRVGPVGHGLHAAHLVLPRLFQLGDRAPVGGAGGGLHQQKGLLFHGAHQIVPHGVRHRQIAVVPAPPLGVGVPAHHVHHVFEFEVVVVVEVVHQVSGHRQGGVHGLHRVPLGGGEVHHLVRDKPLPVQMLDKGPVLPLGPRGVDLLPVGNGVGPEVVPPGVVQGLQGAVLLLQPLAEGRFALGAPALPAVFVGQVPQNHPRVLRKPLRQGGVHLPHLLPVGGGGIAVVVPPAGGLPAPVPPHPADLRVLLAHPQGLRPRGRGQHRVNAVFI